MKRIGRAFKLAAANLISERGVALICFSAASGSRRVQLKLNCLVNHIG